MALQRYYLTTKERLEAMYCGDNHRNAYDFNDIYNNICGLYPLDKGFEFIDVISGCIDFLLDNFGNHYEGIQSVDIKNGDCVIKSNILNYVIQNYKNVDYISIVKHDLSGSKLITRKSEYTDQVFTARDIMHALANIIAACVCCKR